MSRKNTHKMMVDLMETRELPKRKQNRLPKYDYSKAGAYFITVCTKDRKALLSKIVGDGVLDVPETELLKCGKIVEKQIRQLNDFYDDISVEKYVIMPDHIHFILSVNNSYSTEKLKTPNGMSGTPSPTQNNKIPAKTNSAIAKFVSTLKRFSNKEYGKPIWQRSYYDHVIRDQNDYNEKCEYINNNPMKWLLMKNVQDKAGCRGRHPLRARQQCKEL